MSETEKMGSVTVPVAVWRVPRQTQTHLDIQTQAELRAQNVQRVTR